MRDTVISMFRMTLCGLTLVSAMPSSATAQTRGLTENERICVNTIPNIEIEPPISKWLGLKYGTMGQIIMFKMPKGSHMVSKGGIKPFNLNPEMDPTELGKLVSDLGCVSVKFQDLSGGTLLNEFAQKILPTFEAVFPKFQTNESIEVHLLRAIGHDGEQETTLFFVTKNDTPRYAVFIQPWKDSVTAWEAIDGEEWSKRAARRNAELEAMIESQNSKN